MTPTRQVSRRRPFVWALVVALCVCSLSHVLVSLAPLAYRDFVAWPLLPGVALYVVANGSLLFPSGHDAWWHPAVIVSSSTLAWAILFAGFRHGIRCWFRW